jgi:hypothetical protein
MSKVKGTATSELRALHVLVPRSLYEALQAHARAEDRPPGRDRPQRRQGCPGEHHEAAGVSDELPNEHEERARRSFIYFAARVGEPDYEEARALFSMFMSMSWDYTGKPGNLEDSFRPELHPDLALLECLAVLDGWEPWRDDPWKRIRRERISSAELAAILDLSPNALARTLRYFDDPRKGLKIRTRSMRLEGGRPAKAYRRSDLERAWKENWGTFYKRLDALRVKQPV